MRELIGFLASPAGRVTRIVAGIALILIGVFAVGGAGGIVLAVIGLVPLGAGILDVCVFAPLLGFPFSGPAIRRGGGA